MPYSNSANYCDCRLPSFYIAVSSSLGVYRSSEHLFILPAEVEEESERVDVEGPSQTDGQHRPDDEHELEPVPAIKKKK